MRGVAGEGGCATFVAGAIPPSVFRFASVVPQRMGGSCERGSPCSRHGFRDQGTFPHLLPLKMRPSREELLRIVRTFYPSGVQQGDPAYLTSSEILRLEHAREEASTYAGRARWASVLRRIGTELPWACRGGLDLHRAAELLAMPGLPSGSDPARGEPDEGRGFGGGLGKHPRIRARRVFINAASRRRQVSSVADPLPATARNGACTGRSGKNLRSELHTDAVEADALFTPIPDISCFSIPHGRAMLIDALFTDDRW